MSRFAGAQARSSGFTVGSIPGRCSSALQARGAERPALIGLYLFSIAYVGSKALANLGLAMIVGAFLYELVRRRGILFRDAMVRLGAAWVAYLLLLSVWRSLAGMEGTLLAPENLCLAFIPAMAWITRGRHERIAAALLLALLGLLLALVRDLNFDARLGFDYTQTADMLGVNRNISSLILNTAIVGMILVCVACLRRWSRFEAAGRSAIVFPGSIAIFLILMVPWAASPSRTLWLSLLLVVAIVLARTLPFGIRGALMGTSLLFGAFLAVFLQWAWFASVITKDAETWRALIDGMWSSIPNSSTGLRMQMIEMGLESLRENPLFGVANSGSQILKEHPDFLLSHAAQLHNGYLEIVVRTGFVGLLFFAAAIGLAMREAARARREHRSPSELGELLLAALVLHLLVNITNAVVFFQHGWQFLVFFAGVAYGFAQTWAPVDTRTDVQFSIRPDV